MATKNAAPKVDKGLWDKHKNAPGLKKCFQALVDRKQVNLDMCVLKLMLTYELQVDLDSLDPNLAAVIPYMVILYIRNWPGWQKSKEYYSGKLNYREWFIKFRQYIIVRLKFLIKNGYKDVLDSINKEKSEQEKIRLGKLSLIEKGTQTDPLAPKEIAPFTISVECSPRMMGSMVFCAKGDDIFLSHHIEPSWTELTISELVNWPHVGIDFISSELSFKRYNRSEFRRFVNLTSCQLDPIKNEFIEEVNILEPNVARISYTLNRFFAYAQQYLKVLQKMDELNPSKLIAIEVILEEFLKDIEEIGVNNTMATNTSVLFNIGKCTFVRNKKLNKSAQISYTDVGYCETFIPKIEIHLKFFKALQDFSTPDVSFLYLNAVEKMIDEKKEGYKNQVPTLLFRCLFCDENNIYTNHEDLIKHFETIHGMEPHPTCPKCANTINIMTLAKCRWKHVCTKP